MAVSLVYYDVNFTKKIRLKNRKIPSTQDAVWNGETSM